MQVGTRRHAGIDRGTCAPALVIGTVRRYQNSRRRRPEVHQDVGFLQIRRVGPAQVLRERNIEKRNPRVGGSQRKLGKLARGIFTPKTRGYAAGVK